VDLLDVNVLVGAFRPEDPEHARLKAWLEATLNDGLPVTFPLLVEVAFLRIVTHPGIFRTPSTLGEATTFLEALQGSGSFHEAPWTPRMRQRWTAWCAELGLRGNDVNDAFLAAIAAEGRFRLVSCDQGFARFRGLAWWNPVDEAAR
jgi:toxin-antitoxin system PIN domain toxin